MPNTQSVELPDTTEKGDLGVCHLKRLWAKSRAAREGRPVHLPSEFNHDSVVLHSLGLGLEQASQHLLRVNPSFAEFEAWLVETAGRPEQRTTERLNSLVEGRPYPSEVQNWLQSVNDSPDVLDADDLAFWDKNGYVIVRQAITPEDCRAAEQAVWEFMEADPTDSSTWLRRKTNRQGIMLQYFQHPAFERNRRSPRLHKAFAQLWGSPDLFYTTDRCGFNPPERLGQPFQGPDLHWDGSLHQPIPFGTQGILYLTDTEPEQGAFTLVPGFHHKIGEWLANLKPGTDPRTQDLHALGSQPIAAGAGDLIIWHHALPHGSRPNRTDRPRIVQYINMVPWNIEVSDIWI